MADAKANAAKSALKLVPETGAMGLGSGSTVALFATELGKRISSEGLDISVVPSSYQAYHLAIDNGIPLTNLDLNPELVLTVDGADEVDRSLNLIKGGGGAMFQEKVIASASKRLVIVVDESKLVERLGSKCLVPVEVLPFALGAVRHRLKGMGITPNLRGSQGKLGPVVTDNGNFILDLRFPEPIGNPSETAVQLKMIPGIVETGLFVDMVDEVHVGTAKDVRVLRR